jgi:hypothetical protein
MTPICRAGYLGSLGVKNESTELCDLRNSALRKVGRNVVNFQKVEACLKFLIAVTDIETSDNLSGAFQTKRVPAKRVPFGHLVDMFYRTVYGADPQSHSASDETKIVITTSFRLEGDQSDVKRQKRALSALVAERNRLIHKDLSGFDHNSIEACRNLIEILDEQNSRILDQLSSLATVVSTYKVFIAELKAWTNTTEPLRLSPGVHRDA